MTKLPELRAHERGVALILALLVLVLLMALVLEFDANARRELKEATAFQEHFKARALTLAGLKAARAILFEDRRVKTLTGHNTETLTDLWAIPLTNLRIGESRLSAQLYDESSKMNLNSVAQGGDTLAGTANIQRLKRLFRRVGVNPDLVDAITDWVDSDENPRPQGAESVYYRSLQPPYEASDGPLKTLGEIRLVKGVTEDTLRRLTPYVTIYPQDGQGWINLNTADPLVLQTLDERITSTIALEIVQARPFTSIQDADRVTSFEPIAKELRLTNQYHVRSNYFSAELTMTLPEVTTMAHAVFHRSSQTGLATLLAFYSY